jgi:hypothetical protein
MKYPFLLLLTVLSIELSLAQPVTIFISPQGNDANPGLSPEFSKGSLEQALILLKQLSQEREITDTVTLMLAGGDYRITAPVHITPALWGSNRFPLVIRSAGGQRAIFDGSGKITGWKKYKNNIWMAAVPEAKAGSWKFNQLFVNGQPKRLARFPNEGYYIVAGFPDGGEEIDYHTASRRFQFRPGEISPAWRNLNDVRVIVYHFWSDAHLQIESIDSESNMVTFRYPAEKRFTDDFTNEGAKYIVENVFEGLDRPGEWYLDRTEGRLYYIPQEGENMETADVAAPVTPAYFHFTGESGSKPVENIILENLEFRYSNFMLPEGDQNDYQGCATIPASISFRYARNIVIKDCSFSHLGNFALDVQQGCSGIGILQNRIEHCAAGAVKVNGGKGDDHPLDRTRNITVSDNEIGYYGNVYPSAVGVLLMNAGGCYVGHNHIHHGWYTGISVGWNWGYDRSISRDNVIEYNHIHHIGQGLLSDMGGIYTLGLSPGTVLRNNLIHDVDANRYGGWGIYNDEGSSHMLIENNIVYHTKYAAYNIHYAKELTVRNNIFALGRLEVISRGRAEPHTSVYFENNIVYWDSLKDPFSGNWKDEAYKFYVAPMERERTITSNFISDYNLFFCPGMTLDSLRYSGNTWSEWQQRGKDVHSVYADPLFRDAARCDFTLLPGSPAFGLGFRNIDMNEVGPRDSR